MRGFRQHGFQFVERNLPDILAGAQQVHGGVDSGAMQEAGHVAHGFGCGIPLKQAQEYRLQDVFGVARIAGDAERGPEDQRMVLPKNALQVRCNIAVSAVAAMSCFILAGFH